MKKSHFIIVIVTILSLLLPCITVYAQTATPAPSPAPSCLGIVFELRGYVRDIETTDPISDAGVTVSLDVYSSSTYTNENGYYELIIAPCTDTAPLTFTITADGYEERIVSANPSSLHFEFNLIPLPGPTSLDSTPSPTPGPGVSCQLLAFESRGYVTDISTNDPIGGATLTVDATIGTTSKVTDLFGYYYIPVMSCMLGDPATFTITAPGYENLITVLGIGQVNNYDFGLTASDCVLGDVNNDSFIDIIDALIIAQYYVGLIELPYICGADLNCDGENNIIDALLCAQYYVGLITSFC